MTTSGVEWKEVTSDVKTWGCLINNASIVSFNGVVGLSVEMWV